MKVSGYRFGSAELESAFVSHPAVAEAAVIGKPHEIKGESIKGFIILKVGHEPSEELKKELAQQVRKMVGPIATPDEIEFVESLKQAYFSYIIKKGVSEALAKGAGSVKGGLEKLVGVEEKPEG